MIDKSNIKQYIKNNNINITVKPNSKETKITGYDALKERIKLNVNAKPKDNEANLEIIKFFKKNFKLDVKIKRGIKGKNKILYVNS